MKFAVVCVFASVLTVAAGDDSVENVTRQWLEIQSNLEDTLSEHSKSVLRLLAPTVMELDIDPVCLGTFQRLQTGLRDMDAQYTRLLDASGKLASGIIHGTMTDFGNFDECLSTVVRRDEGELYFKGKYCLAEMRFPLPKKPNVLLPSGEGVIDPGTFRKGSLFEHFANQSSVLYWLSFRHGICVPSVCSDADINTIYKKFAEGSMLNGRVFSCQFDEDKSVGLDRAQWCTIICLSIVSSGVVIVSGTKLACSLLEVRVPGIVEKARCLSVDFTLGKIFSDEQKSKNLGFIHGLRVGSLLWILVSHSYAYLEMNSMANASYIQKALQTWFFQPISNGWLVVDSFFCLSGFLVTYHMDGASRSLLSIFMKLILRYWRLVPLAIAVLSYQFLFGLFFEGPLMPLLNDPMTRDCANNWWYLLVGYYDIRDESACLPHFWYVSADLILFAIQVPLSMAIWWRPKFGIALHFIAIVVSGSRGAYLSFVDELPPIIPLGQDRVLAIEVAQRVYFNWCTHLASYTVGSLTAYFALTHKRSLEGSMKRRITWFSQILLWIAAVLAACAALFSARFWIVDKPGLVWSAVYSGSQRILWSSAIGWMMFACFAGYAKCLDRFLGLRQWVPLSRISYAVYLCHAYLLYMNNRVSHERKEASHYSILRDACAVFVFSSILALITSVLIEAPIIALQNIFTKQERSREEPESKLKIELSEPRATRPTSSCSPCSMETVTVIKSMPPLSPRAV